MRYADRLDGVSLSGIRRVFESAGPDAVNLGLGEPNVEAPPGVKEAVAEAADRGELSYTENRGLPELRQLVAEHYNGLHGTGYTESNVLITSGASEALHLAMQALVDPGDAVVLTDPCFVSYPNLAALAGGVPEYLETSQEDRFVPDHERYAEILRGGEALLVLNSPCNPTGAVYPEDVQRALVETSMDAGVPVLSDEVYDGFVYEGRHASAGTMGRDVAVVNSFSKSFGAPGLRVGYLLAPEELVERCLKVHQYVQACAPSVSQAAAVVALTSDEGFTERVLDTFKRRRDLLLEGFRDIGLRCAEPRGAFYAFPDVSEFGGGDLVAEALASRGVLTVPGSAFGSHSGHLRVSYAASTEDLKRGLRVVDEVLPELET